MTFNSKAVDRNEPDVKKVLGGLLVQTPDLTIEDPRKGKVVTRRAPTDAEMRALTFGIKVCKHIKSNAIAFVAEDRTLAVGGGATSRIDPVYAAREKAARLKVALEGSVLVSEALFPFPDGPTLAAEAGATAIAQPGGAVARRQSDRGGRQVRARDGLHGSAPLQALASRAMKVLVIGKGGREHAMVWRLHQSETVWKIFCASGNPGIDQIAEAVPIAPTDVAALVEFAKSKSVDLTIVGPEDVLATGIVDHFTRAGLKIFGPTAAAAQLETSKSFAKTIMREGGVPTADFEAFDDAESARRYVKSRKGSMVVKADGLALGKGVTICHDTASALEAVTEAMERRRFGAAGNRVVVEEFLTGEEVSFFALCDGENAIPLGTFQDHKAIFDGDRGPNTGGMGAYSPVPQFGPEMEARVMREVIVPTLAAMNARGIPFRGLLYAGLMTDGERINVIEFNVRFGDPECEAQMMRLDSDLAENLLAAAEGNVANAAVRLSPRSAVAVVLASGGYPGEYKKGIAIRGLDRLEGNVPSDIKIKWAMKKIRVKVFHSGTAMRDGQLVTDGGRVLTVTAMAPELATAVDAAYEAAEMIEFEGRHFRRDIARRALG